MCGICGWVDYSDDARDHPGRLAAMTATLAQRGPDDHGHWADSSAALGHRRLAVIDPERSRQPMIDPVSGCVLVFSGEVYNFADLRTRLETLGRSFVTAGDTEVVLQGYLHWGVDLVDHLLGMYAFAIWNPRTAELVLVRDRLGIKPFYYATLPDGLVFGSEPKALFASGHLSPRVDGDGVCELLSMARTPGHAVFSGMKELPPGHLAVLDHNGLSVRPYWQLTAHRHPHDLPTTVELIDTVLSDIMAEQLVSDVSLGILLSGGLDSSTLAAFAAELQPERRPPTFCVAFDASRPPPGDLRTGSDTSAAHQVAELIGTTHHTLTLDHGDLSDAVVWQDTLRARDLPPLGDMDSSLYLLFAAVRDKITVAISGEGADEVFGGYPWFHDPLAASAETFPWLAATRRLGRPAAFEPRPTRRLDLADYQRQQYLRAVADVPTTDEPAGAARHRELTFLHLTRFLPIPLDRKDRLAMAVGLEVRVPYCDHRLVQTAFDIPPSLHHADQLPKGLLRRVASRRLPAAITSRPKSPYPTTHDPAYHAALRDRVAALLTDSTSPALEVLHPGTVRALATLPATGSQLVRLGLERVLRIDDWLRQYAVDIVI